MNDLSVQEPRLEGAWLDCHLAYFGGLLVEDRLPHAILLSGPAGVGKRWLAERLADLLLCLAPRASGACGQCRSCKLLGGGAHPERFLVAPEEDSKVIKIEQVRELVAALTLTTTISRRKLAVLVPAELLTRNAANALLKCLEEPPGDTVLILVSNDPGRLPATVRSRCQARAIACPDMNIASAWLQAQGRVPAETALAALEAAGGSPLQAWEWIQQGRLQEFLDLRAGLAALLKKQMPAAGGVLKTGDDPNSTWRCLSRLAAATALAAVTGERPAWLADCPTPALRPLLLLQARADRNRRLTESTVRQDLLLRNWLLEWSRLAA